MYSLDGLQDRLKAHVQSFDSLLNLIPAKYYIIDKDDELNSKYQHNKRKKAPKQAIKEATKKAKKAKLDPENFKSIPELQSEKVKKKQAVDEAAAEEDSGIEEDREDLEMEDDDDTEKRGNKGQEEEDGDMADEELEWEDTGDDAEGDENENNKAESTIVPAGNGAPSKPMESATITDLRLRLQQRIANLRANRRAPANDTKVTSRDAILEHRLKRKRERLEKRKRMKEKRRNGGSEEIVASTSAGKVNGTAAGPSPASIKEDGEVRFSKLEMGEGAGGAQKKKKGPTDAKGQLKKVEAKMEKMEKLKAENKEKAETVAEKETWKKALAMASGEKVRDDIKLLKKTVKREEKVKKRSEKAWSERKDSVQKQQALKQKKRQENIQGRIDQKKDRKMGKGKKGIVFPRLQPKARPGFEGGKPKKSKK